MHIQWIRPFIPKWSIKEKSPLIDAQMRAMKVILRSQRSTAGMHMDMSLAEEH